VTVFCLLADRNVRPTKNGFRVCLASYGKRKVPTASSAVTAYGALRLPRRCAPSPQLADDAYFVI